MAFQDLKLYDQRRQKHIFKERLVSLLGLVLKSKVCQQLNTAFRTIQEKAQLQRVLEEKREIFKKTMKYKVLALVHLLQAKTLQTKSEAFRDLKIFYANYKDMLIYQKQFSAEKTLSDKVKKYASIVETCQKINRKYEEFCYSSKKSSHLHDDEVSLNTTQPIVYHNEYMSNMNRTTVSDKGYETYKVFQFGHPKYKLMMKGLETVYNNRLRAGFTALKRYKLFPALRNLDLNGLEKVRKEVLKQAKLNESMLYNITKVQSVLLDPVLVKQSKSTEDTYSTLQDENQDRNRTHNHNNDLLSAINFLKAL